jgi:hypothetical protein
MTSFFLNITALRIIFVRATTSGGQTGETHMPQIIASTVGPKLLVES